MDVEKVELKQEAQIRIIDICLNALKRAGRDVYTLVDDDDDKQPALS